MAHPRHPVFIRKVLMSAIFPPAILGRIWLRHFYGHLAFFGFFCWKTPVPIKIRVLGGGGFGVFWKGGWKCQFYLYGRGDFSDFRTVLTVSA